MNNIDKPLIWAHGEIATPPFSKEARIETGLLLRRLQTGENLSMPHSKPMPSIGRGCHELRVSDKGSEWRIIYMIAPDAVVIPDVFEKKTNRTPRRVLAACKKRKTDYEKTIA